MAAKTGEQRELPVMPEKREKREESVYIFVIKTPLGYAIRRRESGVLKGMNEFPSHIIEDNETPESVLFAWGVDNFKEIRRKKYKHIFTHIRWEMTCFLVECDSAPFDAYDLEEILAQISLPTAFKQCLKTL